jgi:predicted TIM-barrel fold metal-dependent hydrolase
MSQYRLIDSDHHYYEPDDAWSRHIESRFRDRAINIRRDGAEARVFIGDRPQEYMPFFLSDQLPPPGCFRPYVSGRVTIKTLGDVALLPGDEPPIVHGYERPELVSDRKARLALMDEQNVEACLMLPTHGVTIEPELRREPDLLDATFRAFNRWVEEDWGFSADGRIFGGPMISMVDLDAAVRELQRVIDAGARFFCITPGPVDGRSPADPHFDRFWRIAEEARMFVVIHQAESGYNELFSAQWGEDPRPTTHTRSVFQTAAYWVEQPAIDTLMAFVCHNLFGRFPGLNVLSVENGSTWVPDLLRRMDAAFLMQSEASRDARWLGGRLADLPSIIFREHVYVSPLNFWSAPRENVRALADVIGTDRVLFGSDYPHPEGLAAPMDFVELLDGFRPGEQRKILHDNLGSLLGL